MNESPRKRGDVGNSPHRFDKTNFAQLTRCKFCSNFIWGFPVPTGYLCRDCGYECHKYCMGDVPSMCNLDKEEYKKVINPLFVRKGTNSPQPVETLRKHSKSTKKEEKREREHKKTLSDVGTPYNVSHVTHVDSELNWTGKADASDLFEFKEEIGKTGFGTVVRAIHKETGFVLAVKKYPTTEERVITEVQKEIELLKLCTHRNIVAYYGTVKKENEILILMDYCSVGSVKDLMRVTLETFDEGQIAQVSKETLNGLQYLHKKSIIHTDLKPANILMSAEGEIKLADFGIFERKQKKMLPSSPDFVGSPFMAPEVILKEKFDEKADFWSLGISLIELAEGRAPNEGVTTYEQLKLLASKPPPTLRNPKQWTPSCRDFINKCLTQDPNARPGIVQLLAHPFLDEAKGPDVFKGLIKMCLESNGEA